MSLLSANLARFSGPQFAPGVSASYGAPPHASFPTAAYIAGSSAAYGLPAALTEQQARALYEIQVRNNSINVNSYILK
jgi:hypothetical protein